MNRLDVCPAVHNMQGPRLFDLTVAAGEADPADTATTARLAGAISVLTVPTAARSPSTRPAGPAAAGPYGASELSVNPSCSGSVSRVPNTRFVTTPGASDPRKMTRPHTVGKKNR